MKLPFVAYSLLFEFFPPPPRCFAQYVRNAQSSRHSVLIYSFECCASFEIEFAMSGHTVSKLCNILYLHIRQKNAQKRDFTYNSNTICVSTQVSWMYDYFCFCTFMLFMIVLVSKSNFIEKTTKDKTLKKTINTQEQN